MANPDFKDNAQGPFVLPEKLRILDVDLGGHACGRLSRASTYNFEYGRDDPAQDSLSLLMPPSALRYEDGDLFPSMDMNLPEGYLFQQIREMYPKQSLTPMHLLAIMGDNGIGRIGYSIPGTRRSPSSAIINKQDLLNGLNGEQTFQHLLRAFISTGAGISGIQPKIMVPDRATIPIPTLIVKLAAAMYPGLSANEFVCLQAAKNAGIEVAPFDLSADGELLVIDRFDIDAKGSRLGFEDVASLMSLRVRDSLSSRRYHGSYETVAEVFRMIGLASTDLAKFYEQVAFSVMVRNGDAHLKNFGVLYTGLTDVRLAPMFDVVTTSIYKYTRYEGGPELEDRTMALRLFKGTGGSKTYPTTEELLDFGRRVCGVEQPHYALQRISEGMHQSLADAGLNPRVPAEMLSKMREAWEAGMLMGTTASAAMASLGSGAVKLQRKRRRMQNLRDAPPPA